MGVLWDGDDIARATTGTAPAATTARLRDGLSIARPSLWAGRSCGIHRRPERPLDSCSRDGERFDATPTPAVAAPGLAKATASRCTSATHRVAVGEVGLAATDDVIVARLAREEGRVLVTENVADFAHETDVVLVFVLKRTLPAGAAMAIALTRALADWSRGHPEPYVGAHWPT